MLLQGTDGLHEAALEALGNGHYLAGGLHLGAQEMLCGNELVEGQTRHLHHAVIQHGLEGGVGLAGHGILDLVQCVAQGDLGRYLGNGIAGGLGGQGGGTGYSGIYLDDAVLEAVRIQSVLHIAAAGDAELGDDVQRTGSEHLVFLVRQGLGRRHHNGITGMHAHRVEVFHVADGDHVAGAVPHYLILDFLPACNGALYQHLMHTGKPQTVLQDLPALLRIGRNAAAGAAQGIGRTQHHRIADGLCHPQTVLHIVHHLGGSHRLADLLHGLLEHETVLGLLDGQGCRTDETHIVALQEAGLIQCHGQIQTGLSAQGGQHGIRLLLLNELLHHIYGQGLNVYMVCDVLICHDGGRIGIQQNNLYALLLQRTAGLCACVVKLCCLADDDRSGTDHQHLLYTLISHPVSFSQLSIIFTKRSNK